MKYTHAQEIEIPRGRRNLAKVLREAGKLVKTEDVVESLLIDRREASRLLSRWTRQGWLRRVSRGIYVAAPLEYLESRHVIEDPWILIPTLYEPAYVGGWTAAEFWDLTEQVFRQIVVFTAKRVRSKHEKRHGAQFLLHHVREQMIFGTRPIWRGRSRVLASDLHRTIIDMLATPRLGGGIQHVADCLGSYLSHRERDDDVLMQYAAELGNGAVFKRLGFLVEQHANSGDLPGACSAKLTHGNAKLDPALRCNRLVSRWRLWIPESLVC